jgi:hypothetical protein
VLAILHVATVPSLLPVKVFELVVEASETSVVFFDHKIVWVAMHLEVGRILLIDDVVVVYSLVLGIGQHLLALTCGPFVKVGHILCLSIQVPALKFALLVLHFLAKVSLVVDKVDIVVVDHALIVVLHLILPRHERHQHFLIRVSVLDPFVILLKIWGARAVGPAALHDLYVVLNVIVELDVELLAENVAHLVRSHV